MIHVHVAIPVLGGSCGRADSVRMEARIVRTQILNVQLMDLRVEPVNLFHFIHIVSWVSQLRPLSRHK